MTHPSLWKALNNFQIGEPNVPLTFQRKLADRFNWSSEFTTRAVDAYKKFIYLSAISIEPVSPSAVIDEVWHLHLVYTQSYWKEMCGEILHKEIHHNPGNGRKGENEEYQQIFMQTCTLYLQEFGEHPDPEIWFVSKDKMKRKPWLKGLNNLKKLK